MNFNGGSSTSTSVTSYDRLGRAVLQQKQQGPNSSNYDTVAISYDQRGRANFQTLPYQGTQGQIILSNPGITTQFDALNRMTQVTDGGSGTVTYTYSGNDTLVATGPAPSGENLKQRSLQYNGAGWLSSVCEIVMSTQPAGKSCGQTTNPNGYLTTYAYNSAGWLTQVKQNAQPGSSGVQTRTISYDGLGRKLSETIPEWSAGTGLPGTTYYTYDSASSCSGSSTGDLIKSVDNAGNVTCLTYDSLHRPLSSTVVSGPYASVTPVMNYVYDAATYNGTAMQNAQGNLAEAYTGASSSKITDLYFSKTYGGSGATAGGTVSQVWESTPHSAGYFLTTDTYYPNGALGLRTASYGVPSLSYGLDGEGRPNAATDSTYNLNLVTAASYNPASAATGVSYGNGDSDAFGYDSMNRPNSIAYNVGGSNPMISNALTWNANSSLKSMQVTDNNDTTKSQNCTYSADDLSRIASANCVNKGVPQWAQTFAYDPFGNINKTGNPGTTYSAAYSSVTNQVSGGPSYDANGNQMNSTPANLTWNALNQPITVNSTTATYDALGRMVEKGAGGTYTQFVYCIEGAVLAVYSGGLVKGTIPLPGGGTAVYNANGLNFIRHKDWLGSSRLATTWAHAVYSKEAYAPFGETYNEAGTPDRSFTGQDQDVATGSGGTGVYDFLFRKYDPSAGRWLSPDPAGWGAVSQTVPQSLNRYAYVMNQPMIAVDPAGLILCVSADGTPFDSGYDGCPNDSTSYNEVDSVTVNGDDNPTVPLTPNACNTSDIICQIQYQDFVSGMTYAQFVLQRSNTNALNNAWAYEKKAIICNFQAEGAAAKEGGVSLALDAVGFIPGEGLLNFAAQTGVGLVSTVISANENDAFGAQSSLAGTFLMFAGTVYKSGAVGKAIPILGIGVNTIATLHDLGTTISAGWNAVNACMSQP
jgi:RHS repeat-associated protein